VRSQAYRAIKCHLTVEDGDVSEREELELPK
jgi:hypothetical protein